MRKITLFLLITLGFIPIYGCESVDLSKVSDEDLARLSEKAVVCNEPYIRFGTSCCLDQNNNKICDRDERELTEEEKEKEKDVNKETPSGITRPITETPVEPTPSEKFLPEKCILAPGLACVSHKVEPTTTTLIISNGFGRTIRVTNLQVGACSAVFDKKMVSGVENTFTLTGCSNGVSKEAFKGDIKLTYEDTSYKITKTVYGNLATKVEAGEVITEEPQISWGFNQGEPPAEVTDQGTYSFNIGIELTNNGNNNLEKIIISLIGFVPEDFGKTKSDMIIHAGTLKPLESKVFEFFNLNFLDALEGNTAFTIRAKINYEYLGKGYEESKDVQLLVKHLLEPIGTLG